MPTSTDLLQGTLDLLILQTLAFEPMHGWGIAQRIQLVSKDVLQIGQGSLYPRLYTASNTRVGLKQSGETLRTIVGRDFIGLRPLAGSNCKVEVETWDRLSTAIALVLKQIPEASS